MSKAFTKEDDLDGVPVLPRLAPPVPPGTRNYLTAAGAATLQAELDRLLQLERPAQVAAVTRDGGVDAKTALARLDQRIAYLQESLRTAEVTAVPPPPHDTVRFGATVTIRDARGAEETYRIVGVDEADAARDAISWLSPLARALLNRRHGETVSFRRPQGPQSLTITAIRFDAAP